MHFWALFHVDLTTLNNDTTRLLNVVNTGERLVSLPHQPGRGPHGGWRRRRVASGVVSSADGLGPLHTADCFMFVAVLWRQSWGEMSSRKSEHMKIQNQVWSALVFLFCFKHVMKDKHRLKLWNQLLFLSAVSHFFYCLDMPTEALWIPRIGFNLTSKMTESIYQNQYYFMHFRMQLY